MDTLTASPIEIALPDSLAQRIRAAGGIDPTSIDALLARDSALRTEVQMAIQESVLARFIDIPNGADLMQWADRYPFMLDPGFTEAIEESIDQAKRSGEIGRAQALRQRLDALVNLRAQAEGRFTEMDAPPLIQALMAFLAAEDEESARQVFAQFQTLLQSDEAAQMLAYQFGSDDRDTWQLVQARTQLLHNLRQEAAKTQAVDRSYAFADDDPAVMRTELLQQLASHQALLRKLQEEIILASGRERAILAINIEQEQEAIANLQRQLDDLTEEMGRDSGT
ncbi:MAG: hypothetical protein J5I90_10630 [Caldilineales bacterium]|nr:hypothetical protein [Caldilineales bacterium]